MRYPYNNFPHEYTLSAGYSFGAKVAYGYHSGIDVNGRGGGDSDIGVPIYALAEGKITSVEFSNKGYGNHLHLKIEGAWGTRWSHHCHMQDITVSQGQSVTEGQQVGTIGRSGNVTAAHDHWEIKKKSVGINAVAKSIAALHDGWENPLEFVANYISSSNGNADALRACINDRDINWTVFNRVMDALGIQANPDKKEESAESAVKSVAQIKARAEKVGGLEEQLSTIKSSYESELAVIKKQCQDKDDLIERLQTQHGDIATPYIEQIKAKDKQIQAMAEEIRRLKLEHPPVSVWDLIKRFIGFA